MMKIILTLNNIYLVSNQLLKIEKTKGNKANYQIIIQKKHKVLIRQKV